MTMEGRSCRREYLVSEERKEERSDDHILHIITTNNFH